MYLKAVAVRCGLRSKTDHSIVNDESPHPLIRHINQFIRFTMLTTDKQTDRPRYSVCSNRRRNNNVIILTYDDDE